MDDILCYFIFFFSVNIFLVGGPVNVHRGSTFVDMFPINLAFPPHTEFADKKSPRSKLPHMAFKGCDCTTRLKVIIQHGFRCGILMDIKFASSTWHTGSFKLVYVQSVHFVKMAWQKAQLSVMNCMLFFIRKWL